MPYLDSDLFYSSQEFQKFFKKSTQSLLIKTDFPKFTILAVSDTYLDLVRKQRSDLLGNGVFEAFPGSETDPNEANVVLDAFIKVIETKAASPLPAFRYEIFNADTGNLETYYWSNVNEPILDEFTGNAGYIINTTTNITEQIRQKQELEESESRFRLMSEGTDVMIAVSDETGVATYFNRAWIRVTGRPIDKLLKLGWTDLIHPEDKASVLQVFTEAFKVQKPWEWEFRMPDPNSGYRWLLARGTPRFRNDGSFAGYISSTIDITEQKEQRRELQDLIEQLQSTNEELAATNEEIEAVNEELLQAQENLIDTNTQLLEIKANLVAANQRLSISEQTLQTAIQSANLGVWYINAQTREIVPSPRVKELFGFSAEEQMPLNAAIDQIVDEHRDNVVNAINAAIEKNEGYDIEYPVVGFHDKKVRWVRATGKLYIPGDGGEAIFSGTIADVTEQRQNEQRKNDFISMVSHELKTPLTTIQGYIQILQSKALHAGNIQASSMLDRTNKQVSRMTTLINGFLNVSRLESGQIHINKQIFNMAELFLDIEEETLASVTSHTVKFAAVERIFVDADRDKIGQVINNLISNAVKYSPPGSIIDVACTIVAGVAKVSVTDQGIGVSEKNLPQLFNRFFRIDNHGYETAAGFGIGLYLCFEIIKRHGGKIWADSELGQGSTFYFTLSKTS